MTNALLSLIALTFAAIAWPAFEGPPGIIAAPLGLDRVALDAAEHEDFDHLEGAWLSDAAPHAHRPADVARLAWGRGCRPSLDARTRTAFCRGPPTV